MNALGADADLPGSGEKGTDMRCLTDAVAGLEETAYAHHIERLMLFGNLMLLLGVEPSQAFRRFDHSFVDGYEWVMAPNAIGMATYADGGRMMTKPYAASGRYVDRCPTTAGGAGTTRPVARARTPAPTRRSTGTSSPVTASGSDPVAGCGCRCARSGAWSPGGRGDQGAQSRPAGSLRRLSGPGRSTARRTGETGSAAAAAGCG